MLTEVAVLVANAAKILMGSEMTAELFIMLAAERGSQGNHFSVGTSPII
jgi:hypothetical protein